CEAALDTAANCGACGVSCLFEGGSGTCVDGECVLDTCAPGFADCNADASDGCETPLNTPSDCGACGRTCSLPNATATCTAGSCAIESCDAGFGDCDGDARDGCEAPCSLPNATETCASGTCEIAACNPGRGDCDGNPANGCEVNTNTSESHCGTCGNACDPGDECRSGVCR